jgi:hypothetical protein
VRRSACARRHLSSSPSTVQAEASERDAARDDAGDRLDTPDGAITGHPDAVRETVAARERTRERRRRWPLRHRDAGVARDRVRDAWERPLMRGNGSACAT